MSITVSPMLAADSPSDAGRKARAWAKEHRDLDPEQWIEGDGGDGLRTSNHPEGYRIVAWLSGNEVHRWTVKVETA